jgi:hypothetical protein
MQGQASERHTYVHAEVDPVGVSICESYHQLIVTGGQKRFEERRVYVVDSHVDSSIRTNHGTSQVFLVQEFHNRWQEFEQIGKSRFVDITKVLLEVDLAWPITVGADSCVGHNVELVQ